MIWAVLIGNTRTVAALMEKTKARKRLMVPTRSLVSRRAPWFRPRRSEILPAPRG